MPVRDITDRTAIAEALANTYVGEREGWERVLEYQRVMEYVAEHPDQKSTAVSNALDLPRSRIRPWVESGGSPDPAKGVEVAEEHRWLDLDWREPPFSHLNVTTAWLFAGGSINTNFVPAFAVESAQQRTYLERIHQGLGLEYQVKRDDDPSRATEFVPGPDASVFGRLLVALGAPQGPKNVETALELPLYLAAAPRETRLDFARTYAWIRGTQTQDRPNWPIALSEERRPVFKRELRAFFRSLADDPDHISGGSSAHTLYLSSEAAELLYREPDCD